MKITQNSNDYCDLDALRRLVKAFDNLNESFNQQFTVKELVKIYNAWQACGIAPNEWTTIQLEAAKHGIYPRFK